MSGPGPALAAFLAELPALLEDVGGHLSLREARFLALIGACPTAEGSVLEIGSFQGRSTVVLAKAAALSSAVGVVAVDPLNSPSSTDPDLGERDSCEAEFRANLQRHGVAEVVEFHRMCSAELARGWGRPLRLLWIDGDHTMEGARADLEAFAPYLQDGGIVALHDVLHAFEGPLRVFAQDILEAGHARAAGVCGSIGWAQWRREPGLVMPEHSELARRLRRMVPLISPPREHGTVERLRYKLLRWRLPHGDVEPQEWWAEVGDRVR